MSAMGDLILPSGPPHKPRTSEPIGPPSLRLPYVRVGSGYLPTLCYLRRGRGASLQACQRDNAPSMPFRDHVKSPICDLQTWFRMVYTGRKIWFRTSNLKTPPSETSSGSWSRGFFFLDRHPPVCE